MEQEDYEKMLWESARNQRESLFKGMHQHEIRLTITEVTQQLEAKHAKEIQDFKNLQHAKELAQTVKDTADQDKRIKEQESFRLRITCYLVVAGIGCKLLYENMDKLPI